MIGLMWAALSYWTLTQVIVGCEDPGATGTIFCRFVQSDASFILAPLVLSGAFSLVVTSFALDVVGVVAIADTGLLGSIIVLLPGALVGAFIGWSLAFMRRPDEHHV